MRISILTALLLVSGCASVGDIQNKPVAATFASDHSVAEISSCLAGVLSAPKGALVKTVPTEGGVILAESTPVNFTSTVSQTTEIKDLGSQRSVEVRSVARFKPKDVERVRKRYATCL